MDAHAAPPPAPPCPFSPFAPDSDESDDADAATPRTPAGGSAARPLPHIRRRAPRRRPAATAKRPRSPHAFSATQPPAKLSKLDAVAVAMGQSAGRGGLDNNGFGSISPPPRDVPDRQNHDDDMFPCDDYGEIFAGLDDETPILHTSAVSDPHSASAAPEQFMASLEALPGTGSVMADFENELRGNSRAEEDSRVVEKKLILPTTIWSSLADLEREAECSPRIDQRFVASDRPIERMRHLKASIALTLFSDGYVRHDHAPSRPVTKPPGSGVSANSNASGTAKCAPALSLKEVASLPRYPYDRASRDLLTSLELGFVPSDDFLPEPSTCAYFDGCLIAEIHDARGCMRHSSWLPSANHVASSVTTGSSNPSANGRSMAAATGANGLPSPLPGRIGYAVKRAAGSTSASPSSSSHARPTRDVSYTSDNDIISFRILLRPDSMRIMEDIEKITASLRPEEVHAVEELILRWTSKPVHLDRPPMGLRVGATTCLDGSLSPFNLVFAPRSSSDDNKRGLRRGQQTPSYSAAALMLIAGAERQQAYYRDKISHGRTAAILASNTSASAAKVGKSHSSPSIAAASSSKASSSPPQNATTGASRRHTVPPQAILRPPVRSPTSTISSASGKPQPERLRSMRLILPGRQAAAVLQLAQAAQASGGGNSEAAKGAVQKAMATMTNGGRPFCVIEVFRRPGRGCDVIFFRGVYGEKERDMLRLHVGNEEKARLFLEQFRKVTMQEGYIFLPSVPSQHTPQAAQQRLSHGQAHENAKGLQSNARSHGEGHPQALPGQGRAQAQSNQQEQALGQTQPHARALAQSQTQSQVVPKRAKPQTLAFDGQAQTAGLTQARVPAQPRAPTQSYTQSQIQAHSQAQAPSQLQQQSQQLLQAQAQPLSSMQKQDLVLPQAQSQTQVPDKAKLQLRSQIQAHIQAQSNTHTHAQALAQAQAQAQATAQGNAQALTQVQAQTHAQAQRKRIEQVASRQAAQFAHQQQMQQPHLQQRLHQQHQPHQLQLISQQQQQHAQQQQQIAQHQLAQHHLAQRQQQKHLQQQALLQSRQSQQGQQQHNAALSQQSPPERQSESPGQSRQQAEVRQQLAMSQQLAQHMAQQQQMQQQRQQQRQRQAPQIPQQRQQQKQLSSSVPPASGQQQVSANSNAAMMISGTTAARPSSTALNLAPPSNGAVANSGSGIGNSSPMQQFSSRPDVVSFAPAYGFPSSVRQTIAQQQHSAMLQQQITELAQRNRPQQTSSRRIGQDMSTNTQERTGFSEEDVQSRQVAESSQTVRDREG